MINTCPGVHGLWMRRSSIFEELEGHRMIDLTCLKMERIWIVSCRKTRGTSKKPICVPWLFSRTSYATRTFSMNFSVLIHDEFQYLLHLCSDWARGKSLCITRNATIKVPVCQCTRIIDTISSCPRCSGILLAISMDLSIGQKWEKNPISLCRPAFSNRDPSLPTFVKLHSTRPARVRLIHDYAFACQSNPRYKLVWNFQQIDLICIRNSIIYSMVFSRHGIFLKCVVDKGTDR